MIKTLLIDEKRIYTLTKYSDKKGNKNVKESDHNVMILDIIANWKTSIEETSDRIEIYNYQNNDDFEMFRNETENNEQLRDCYKDENEDLEIASKRWLSIVNKNIIKCFKKIRIKKQRVNKDLENLFAMKDELKSLLAQTDEDSP